MKTPTGRRPSLAARQADFRAVFDALGEGVMIVSGSGSAFIEVNPLALELFGYTRDEFLKLDPGTILVLSHPDSLDEPATLKDALQQAKPIAVDRLHATKGGQRFWAAVSVRPIAFAGEDAFLITIRDITELKRRDDALRGSEAKYRDFIADTLDATMVVDASTGRFISANPSTVKLFGVKDEEEFISGSPWTYSPERQPDGRSSFEKARENIQLAMDRGSLLFEWQCKRVDGSEFPADVLLTRAQQGNEPLLFASVRDLTERKQLEESLRTSRERLALATKSAHIGIWDLDIVTGSLTWDAQMYELYGIRESDFSGAYDAWEHGLHPDDRDRGNAAIRDAIDGIKDFDIEFRVVWPNGEVHDIEAHALTQGTSGTATRMIGLNWDITERKRTERMLARSASVLKATIDSSPEGVLVADSTGKIVAYNQRFLELWGIPPELADAGIDAAVIKAGAQQVKDSDKFIERVRFLYEHPDLTDSAEIEFNDGRVFDRHTSSLRYPSGEQIGRIWFFLDVTQRKRTEEQISKMARHDLLTGLTNRGVFVDMLEKALQRARRGAGSFAVLYMDLDHFKDVNDTLGHPVGDQLLQAVADRLRANLRKGDTVARFGGDEFAVLVSDIKDPLGAAVAASRLGAAIGEKITVQQATVAAGEIAGKLVHAVGKAFSIRGNEIHSGASIGIAVYEPGIPDAETMLSHADLALYRAKTEARGTYRFFNTAMDDDVRARVALGSELREAIRSGQLFLAYQPQIELASGRIVGVEALVRWQHPVRGTIGPGHFIPEAERSGLVVPLGEWVVREACRQAKEWLDEHVAPRSISLNISGVQFKRPLELENTIARAAAEFEVPRGTLELELTEGVLMEASREHSDLLQRFHQSGYRIAIDDFGTGYSSLDYLLRYSVDRIKIAQIFITDIGQGSRNDAIVKAALGLARELEIEVVVEGAETVAQVDLLRSWGCQIIQGFYFSRPLIAADMTRALRIGRITPPLAVG